jgi:TPP-dependent pyruvate/acetoin dehydrogenase alpha subunit
LANLSDRAVAYGIPGMTIDGNDVMAVFKASGECINRARRGDGPSIVECKTYRYHGHFEGDPQTYKPKAEIEDWMKKDPIPRFRLVLIGMGILSQDFAESIDRELNMEIDQAIKFAVESPHPAPEETLEDVYA